jgi:hypothetical protein
MLADTAGVDWTQPLAAWSKDTMSAFLLVAWDLIRKAETARDHGPARSCANQNSMRRLVTHSLSPCEIRADPAAAARRGPDQVAALGAVDLHEEKSK